MQGSSKDECHTVGRGGIAWVSLVALITLVALVALRTRKTTRPTDRAFEVLRRQGLVLHVEASNRAVLDLVARDQSRCRCDRRTRQRNEQRQHGDDQCRRHAQASPYAFLHLGLPSMFSARATRESEGTAGRPGGKRLRSDAPLHAQHACAVLPRNCP